MKITYIVIALIVLGGLGWFVFGNSQPAAAPTNEQAATSTQTSAANGSAYSIDTTASVINWAGSKPLIPGYVDSGTLGIKEGTLSVNGASGSGTIVIDMTTVHVGSTSKKPGMESALEGHLKKSDFFDIATYPTATFTITDVKGRADSPTSSMYDVSGTLTMKGKTNPVTFPAKIFLQDGKLHAEASLTIDRTKWGITFGSKDFFASIAENAISNDVKLDLKVVASAQ